MGLFLVFLSASMVKILPRVVKLLLILTDSNSKIYWDSQKADSFGPIEMFFLLKVGFFIEL